MQKGKTSLCKPSQVTTAGHLDFFSISISFKAYGESLKHNNTLIVIEPSVYHVQSHKNAPLRQLATGFLLVQQVALDTPPDSAFRI